ncbi:MAG: ABC transporter ATP-binding protein/permease [Firmicutes bacterium]|nr:ABC transporter ATP-binding protein/permease [Bacillota bacterium]
MKTFRRLISYLLPYWKYLVVAFVCTVLINASMLAQPLFLKIFTDKVLMGKDIKILNFLILGFLGLIVIKGFFTYAQNYMLDMGGQSSLKKMRDHVFQHIQFLPMVFFERWRLGEIMSRATNDIMMSSFLSSEIMKLVSDLVVVAGALSWMFYKDWSLTLLSLVVSPLISIAITKFGKHMKKATDRLQAKAADLSNILYEALFNIKVVKSFTREKFEIEKFENITHENFWAQIRRTQIVGTQAPVVEFLGTLGICIVIWYGAYEIIIGKFTMGEMMAYWGYMVIAVQPLSRVATTLANFQAAFAAAERVFEILDHPTEVKDSADAVEMPSIKGRIEFDDISFSYDKKGSLVLKEINLAINEGEILALVGPNGAGKTSLVNLVPKFYEPIKGAVKVDGMDIRKFKLESLRKQIAIVPQETMLFGGTAKENISYGKLDATMDEIVAAAKAANAHNFIMALPKQYDTPLGERAMKLSGGQRQRLSIARAILRNPKILILDEATSSLDPESENQVQDAIERLMKGRTCLVIAHRLSTVRNANKIAVMEDGRVVETGTHMELLERCGTYTRLYEAQLQNLEAI